MTTNRSRGPMVGLPLAAARCRGRREDKLAGAGKAPVAPPCAWCAPAALLAAGPIPADQLADGEPEAVIARRRAERVPDADHDELLTLRPERAALRREIELLREDVAPACAVTGGC